MKPIIDDLHCVDEHYKCPSRADLMQEEIRGRSIVDMWSFAKGDILENKDMARELFEAFWDDNPKRREDIFSDIFDRMFVADKFKLKLEDITFELESQL